MKRWSFTYHICENETVARRVCEKSMRGVSAYVKKKYPAHYTQWNYPSEKYSGYFVAWVPCYSIK